MKYHALTVALSSAFVVLLLLPGAAPPQKDPGYDNTPFLPGDTWRVHDGKRPQPAIVAPGTFSTQDVPGKPPSDAIVLFDGKDLSQWQMHKGGDAGWTVKDGYMEVTPKQGSIMTRDAFGDCQLHIEWATPTPPTSSSQGRGNSGVFLMKRYEVQVLDSYENVTYPDGQASAMYGQYPPLVNASRKPGEWQVYDIIFMAPRFKGKSLVSPARLTVFHNGVLTHHDQAFLGPTVHKRLAKYTPQDPKGPLQLQNHGNPIRYRNIWIRPLKGYDEP